MNKREKGVILSDKLKEHYIQRDLNRIISMRRNDLMPTGLSALVKEHRENNNSVQLWIRHEGFDVVVIENNDVSFCTFYDKYDTALAYYTDLKQQIFKTKEEK